MNDTGENSVGMSYIVSYLNQHRNKTDSYELYSELSQSTPQQNWLI